MTPPRPARPPRVDVAALLRRSPAVRRRPRPGAYRRPASPVAICGRERRGGRDPALTNLVDNAVRHAAPGRPRRHGGGTPDRVTVTDDGHGIPVEDRERVFDRFTRLDEARDRDSGGSGLGLPITRALLRRSGGDVRLEDAGRACEPWSACRRTADPAHPYGGAMAPVRQVQVTFDCADPERVARFWCEVLGYVVPPPPEGFAIWDEFDRSLPPERPGFGVRLRRPHRGRPAAVLSARPRGQGRQEPGAPRRPGRHRARG